MSAGLALLLTAAPAAGHSPRTQGQAGLTAFETDLESRYPGVTSLLPHQVDQVMRRRDDLLILDVRDAEEFNISHSDGAVLVDPAMTPAAFMARFGHQLQGRKILLYCSVGVRSSRLTERIQAVAREAGAEGAYNIRGGIFAWHNYGLHLERNTQRTEFVHPYSRSWTRYLDFPNYARFRQRP